MFDPTLLEVEVVLRKIFGLRLGMISLEDCTAYFTVEDSSRFERINGTDILKIAIRFDIDPARVEIEGSAPDGIRFIVDLCPVTKPDGPAAIAKERP